MGKRRVVLSVDADIYEGLQKELKEAGFPRGTVSFIAEHAFDRYRLELEAIGKSESLKLLLDMREIRNEEL